MTASAAYWTRSPTHQRGLIVHEKCERLPAPVHGDGRSVEHGFAVGMAGPHLEQTWLFCVYREPALACGRSARSSVFVSSYGVYPAAFERRYDPDHSCDVVELWVSAGSIDRRPGESEALRRWLIGVRSESAHWTPAGGEP